jgi:ATP-dependent DNA helicase DinG
MSDELRKYLGNQNILRIKDPFLKNIKIVKIFEEIVKLISSESFGKSLNLSDEGTAELENLINNGREILADLTFLINVSNVNSYVYWCEKKSHTDEIILKSVPIMVNNILKEYLFENVTAVLTSATLSTGNNFDYISERIGLIDYKGLKLESPFDYKKNCLLFVPQKTVSPKSTNYYDFVTDKCREILKITKGNSFVLFTSYKAMNYCYDLLEDWLFDNGYQPFIQSIGESYNTTLQNYRASKNPVLFATNSFWEGVDVPGEKLSCVIITKLPFNVPTKPIEMARVERIRSQGCNDFLQYSVPKAVIRLKQGFGRLIRSTDDKGVVAVLDSRIIVTGYGKYFLNSLPKTLRNRSLKAVEKMFTPHYL